jgi:glycosyltransferase involved in cell wall biosynthesis
MDSIEKLVSVVIPVRNGMPYLERAIESVLSQDYPAIELIISDDASLDGSDNFIQEILNLDKRVRMIRPERTLTIGQHWSWVTSAARGTYIKLLCSDDVLTPGSIKRQVENLEKYSSAGMLASKRNIIDSKGKILIRSRGLAGLSGLVNGNFAVRRTLESGTNIFGEPCCVLFKREAIMSALPWNDSDPYMLDIELYVRVLSKSDIYCSGDVDAEFRIHNRSLTSRVHRSHGQQFRRLLGSTIDRGFVEGSWRFKLRVTISSSIITLKRDTFLNLLFTADILTKFVTKNNR